METLEQKKLVTHSKDSRRYVYLPAVSEKKAKTTALKQLLATFFEGSPEKLVASLLDPKDQKLSTEEIARIRKLIGDSGGKWIAHPSEKTDDPDPHIFSRGRRTGFSSGKKGRGGCLEAGCFRARFVVRMAGGEPARGA